MVSASNAGGESANSTPASATLRPPAPSGLTASPGNNQVALSWTAASGATSYTLMRGTNLGGPYPTVVATGPGTSTTDTGLTNGTTYYYVVTASNGGGESGPSTEASAMPQVAPPSAPTGLTAATTTSGDGPVALSWTASSGTVDSYSVKR